MTQLDFSKKLVFTSVSSNYTALLILIKQIKEKLVEFSVKLHEYRLLKKKS